jgi:hypothetical protein
MSESRNGSAFERVLIIVHDGLRSSREHADDVRRAAKQLEVSFMDVVATAIACEIVKEFKLEELPVIVE